MDTESSSAHPGPPHLVGSGDPLPKRRVEGRLLLALIVAVEAAWLVAIVVAVIWFVAG